MVYIVSYDLDSDSSPQHYDELIEKIKSEENWARIGGSAYLVVTTLSAIDLRNKLNQVLVPGDQLFVFTVTTPAAWHSSVHGISNWIKSNLR